MKIRTNTLAIIAFGLMITSCGQSENKQSTTLTNETPVDNTIKSETVVPKLDSATYEILATDHQPVVENFHILLKTDKLDKVSLQDFVDRFRQEFCNIKCNISLYDDKAIKSLVTKYPLGDKEYLKVADHFVATSTFDMTGLWLYPFQDIKYKELGGKNWKKEPIK